MLHHASGRPPCPAPVGLPEARRAHVHTAMYTPVHAGRLIRLCYPVGVHMRAGARFRSFVTSLDCQRLPLLQVVQDAGHLQQHLLDNGELGVFVAIDRCLYDVCEYYTVCVWYR